MLQDLLSPLWPRVAALKPRLRAHARVHRHEYRGKTAYVLQDEASRRVHHFNPAAYELIGLMDGTLTLDAIWQAACRKLGDGAPGQDEAIRLLAQLHRADVVQCDNAPDLDELARRTRRFEQARIWGTLLNPLSIKFGLFDPERLLQRTLPWYRWAFTRAGLVLWLLAVGAALVVAGEHWSELGGDVTDRVLAPRNLVLLWVVFPVLKALHELGHACAVKRFGGEVHEMGVMLLVLLPIPYVDASAASALPGKYQRAVVGCAGMAVELVAAAVSLAVWLGTEPGVIRSIAYNIMFIAGVSTVIFNANPLMRFDGYYVLGDLLEIPNLRLRANRFLASLAERHLFGLPDTRAEPVSFSEGFWLLLYGVASFLYRIFISFAIGLFVAGKYFVVGVLLALWSVAGTLVVPLLRALSYLLSGARVASRRGRAIAVSCGLAALMAVLLLAVPMPLHTRAEGILWIPREGVVLARTDGFVRRVIARPDAMLHAGDPILELSEPTLAAQVDALAARVEELDARLLEEGSGRSVRSENAREELEAARAELGRARERQAGLVVTSPVDGRLILPQADDLPGRYVRQGARIAFVVDPNRVTARVIVSQQDADLVRSRTRSVEVLRADDLGHGVQARMVRDVPAATTELPNLALAIEGGGHAALDPRERGVPRALQRYFEVELELPPPQPVELGERVYVRFDHGREPLVVQWSRSLRQLFLRRLNV